MDPREREVQGVIYLLPPSFRLSACNEIRLRIMIPCNSVGTRLRSLVASSRLEYHFSENFSGRKMVQTASLG
jgi:hypothetical protein